MVLWLQEFDLVSKQLAHSKVTASVSLFVTISINQSVSLSVSQNCSQFFHGLAKK